MKRQLASFARLADCSVVEPGGRFYIFGQGIHDALVVVGSHRTRLSKTRIQKLSNKPNSITAERKRLLIEDVKRFSNLDAGEHLGSFSILAGDQKTLRGAISKMNASHIEFSCDDEGARAFLFDVASLNGSVLWRSTFVSGATAVDLHNARSTAAGSFSMKCSTFLKMPADAYSVSLYNDYAIFSSPRSDTNIYVRDQEMRRPFCNVFSDRLLSPITFLFHSKS